MHVKSGCSGNGNDFLIPSLPCSDNQPVDSPNLLMAGLGTKHRVWFQRFGTNHSESAPIKTVELVIVQRRVT